MAKAIWLGRSSFETGFLNGLAGKPLPWTIPAWYSVNGVKVPALPKWNTGKYPNALLWCVDPEKLKVCILYVMSGPVKVVDGQLIAAEDMELRAYTNQPHNNAVAGGFSHWRPLDSWSKAEGELVAYGPSAVIWTNFDLYDTDDTLYLAATTPTVWVDEVTGDDTGGDEGAAHEIKWDSSMDMTGRQVASIDGFGVIHISDIVPDMADFANGTIYVENTEGTFNLPIPTVTPFDVGYAFGEDGFIFGCVVTNTNGVAPNGLYLNIDILDGATFISIKWGSEASGDDTTGDVTTGDDTGGGPMIERNLYFLGWLIGNRIASMREKQKLSEEAEKEELYYGFDQTSLELYFRDYSSAMSDGGYDDMVYAYVTLDGDTLTVTE